MFDPNLFAFAGVAALLVVSPGATMAVVADASIDAGRRAGLWTVAGVGTANSTLAVASAFGLAALVHRFPECLKAIAVAGTAYLLWLGGKAMTRAFRSYRTGRLPGLARGAGRSRHRNLIRGLITNYSNPSVILFYTVVVPQFITPRERFLPRYLLLGGTHVAMSIVWLCAFAVSVGTLAERLARPGVRRVMDLAMAVALLGLAAKVALSQF
jgi:threonine/homoserine/homoserine lactone efflux protein